MTLPTKILLGFLAFVGIVLLNLKWLKREVQLLKSDKKAWAFRWWKEWGEPILIALCLALLVRTFIVQAFKIPTGSMRPTFMENDRILVEKMTYRFHPPERGDIIVFKYPLDRKKDFVKRLIALPGEKVEIKNGHVYINGKMLEEPVEIRKNYYYNRNDWDYGKEGIEVDVPKESYFVLGDNSAQSKDSRDWGFVPKKYLRGKAFLIYWPPHRFRLVS